MKIIIALTISLLFVTGCASRLTGDHYTREEARKPQAVTLGTVIETRMIQIEGTKTEIGSIAGAAIGGVAAQDVGSGVGTQLAIIVGVLAGGILGSKAEEEITKKQGIEVTVELDGDRGAFAYVMEHDPNIQFTPGQRVRVIDGRNSRVVPGGS